MNQKRTCMDSKDWTYEMMLQSPPAGGGDLHGMSSPISSRISIVKPSADVQIVDNNLSTHQEQKSPEKSDRSPKNDNPLSFIVYKTPEQPDSAKPLKKLRRPSLAFLTTHLDAESTKSSSDEEYTSTPKRRPLFSRSHKVFNSERFNLPPNPTKRCGNEGKLYVPLQFRKDSTQSALEVKKELPQNRKEFVHNKGLWADAIIRQESLEFRETDVSLMETGFTKKLNVHDNNNNNNNKTRGYSGNNPANMYVPPHLKKGFIQNVMEVKKASSPKSKQSAQERLLHLKKEFVKPIMRID